MDDVGATNHGDAAVVEKCGRGRPHGSKNKPKSSLAMATTSSSTSAKCRPGHPLRSKNKKSVVVIANPTDHLDVSLVRPSMPSSTSGHLFSFFYFTGAQCREQQRLPAKFTEFMEGRELRKAVLHESSGGGPSYELEAYYDGNGDSLFRGGWDRFVEDHDIRQGWILMFDHHRWTAKFYVKIYDGTQCQKK
jgi:hypothetical protein